MSFKIYKKLDQESVKEKKIITGEKLTDILFKINGERNSGTNFLAQLLDKNDIPIYVQKRDKNFIEHYKHGIPDNSVKQLNNTVIDIFIFRELTSWLKSMFINHYELKVIESFKNFLTQKQYSNNYWKDNKTKDILNMGENGKTIFEIRYYKYNAIVEYKNNNKNVIFISLGFIQNKNNCENFLKSINEKYNLKRVDFICEILKHTKINKNIKNRDYNIDINEYIDIINNHKNNEI